MEEISHNIQEAIKNRARSYTPEWRFDTKHPDIGSALAICFAKMTEETIKQFSKVPLKNKIAFLNELDAVMLPAVPSHGYIQFTLINEEAEGTAVAKKTVVLAQDNTFPDGQVLFETQEDVYVTPAAVSAVYQTCDREDVVYELYDVDQKPWEPFTLFGFSHENIQKHELYFAHDTLFHIKSEAYIEAAFSCYGKILRDKEEIKQLADCNKAVFEYYSQDGWTSFEMTQVSENGLILYKSAKQPPFAMTELENAQSYWVRCRLLQYMPFSKLYFDSIKLSSWCKQMLPDTVFGSDRECDLHTYTPFGERLDLYDEVYFGSEEALSKKGAQIVFSYGIHFEQYPLDATKKEPMEWEWVMKKSDIRQEPEFDVTIAAVVWEYYNGSGWTRLFAKEENSRAFSPDEEKNGNYRTLRFICPDNIEKVLVNAVETYYIRARIVKINHLYKQTGNYWIPVLDNTSICYRYEENTQTPQKYIFHNNLEQKSMELAAPSRAFVQTDVDERCMYLGFRTAPIGNPIKILFCLDDDKECQNRSLIWEYWDGRKWKNLNPADETRNFQRTGLVIFAGMPDMKIKALFGRTYYWIRIRETQNGSAAGEAHPELPMLLKLCMNVTTIENVHKREREFFQMSLYQEDKAFELLEKNIYEASVYVEEGRHLSEEEYALLKQKKEIRIEEEAHEQPQRIWVQWKQVTDFSDSKPQDRHFVIDQSAGKLIFGNGTHGKLPYLSNFENIRIEYCTKGGAYTNLPAGSVDKLERSIGYIHRIANPKALTGGCDAETPQQAMNRSVAMLRHQSRAVTLQDYEELVLCAVREARAVKCFAGYDGKGKRTKGAVTVVILPKQFRQGQMQFHEIRDRLIRYLNDKVSAVVLDNRKLFVVPPELIEIRLHIALSVVHSDRMFQIKQEILERIEEFLRPQDCQSKKPGWQIGSFPNGMQIQNAIHDIEGITYIRSIVMSTYRVCGIEKKEIDVEQAKAIRYVLPVSGEHEITIITQ